MTFERPGLELGMYSADADFSAQEHQYTAVWLGVGTVGTTIAGNAAILKKAQADNNAPAVPKQKDSFTLTDPVAAGTTYSFKLGGELISHVAGASEDAAAVLGALGTAAVAEEANLQQSVDSSGTAPKLVLEAKTADAFAYSDFVALSHTSDVPAPAPGSNGNEAPGAGELKGGPIGILQNCPLRGEACLVLVSGISIVRAGGEWAPGDTLGTDADGNVVKHAGGPVLGIASEGATKGALSSILLLPRSAV